MCIYQCPQLAYNIKITKYQSCSLHVLEWPQGDVLAWQPLMDTLGYKYGKSMYGMRVSDLETPSICRFANEMPNRENLPQEDTSLMSKRKEVSFFAQRLIVQLPAKFYRGHSFFSRQQM